MSIRLMSQVWEVPTESPAEKLVLLALADRADDEGNNVRPSKCNIAARCCLARRTVQRVVDKLEASRVLVLVAQRPGFPTVYRLDVARLKALAEGVPECHTPTEDVRHDDTPPATPRRTRVRREATPPCDITPHNPPVQPSEQTPDNHPDGDLCPNGLPTPAYVADWPILHVRNGDYEVLEPYASDPGIREGLTEWLSRRLEDKKKGMPTAFAMRRDNCGWWDKYPVDAVRFAVLRSASRGWQGILEDVAREWKPEQVPGSSYTNSVQQRVQNMADMMDRRQQMIREAANLGGQPQLMLAEGEGHGG